MNFIQYTEADVGEAFDSRVAVVLDHVSFHYAANVPVIQDLSLSIPRGQWVTLVGANGCGKSTLVKLINGLLPISGGAVYVGGMLLSTDTLWDIRQRVGMVFQNPDNQFIGTTIEEDIAFGLEGLCLPREEIELRVCRYAERMGITPLLKRHPSEVSGGQKQRVAIASILAMEPQVIIFDEATSMLDESSRHDFIRTLRGMHESGRYTILSITHDAEEISVSERVLALHEGHLIADINPQQLFKDEELMHLCRLQPPFDIQMESELQRRGLTGYMPHSYSDGTEEQMEAL